MTEFCSVWQRLAALHSTFWSRGLLSQAGKLDTTLFHAGNQGSSVDQPEGVRKGSVKALYILSTGRVLCFQWHVFFFFLSLCFEILSCWTHTWAVFQPRLWRQQAERRPLIFLPKELFTPSADVSLAEAQVSSRSQQYSSNEINRMLWLERWKTHTHTSHSEMFYKCEMISRQCPLIEFALILK